MQAAQRSLERIANVVVLNESIADARFGKVSSIPNFRKEAARITDSLGYNDLNLW